MVWFALVAVAIAGALGAAWFTRLSGQGRYVRIGALAVAPAVALAVGFLPTALGWRRAVMVALVCPTWVEYGVQLPPAATNQGAMWSLIVAGGLLLLGSLAVAFATRLGPLAAARDQATPLVLALLPIAVVSVPLQVVAWWLLIRWPSYVPQEYGRVGLELAPTVVACVAMGAAALRRTEDRTLRRALVDARVRVAVLALAGVALVGLGWTELDSSYNYLSPWDVPFELGVSALLAAIFAVSVAVFDVGWRLLRGTVLATMGMAVLLGLGLAVPSVDIWLTLGRNWDDHLRERAQPGVLLPRASSSKTYARFGGPMVWVAGGEAGTDGETLNSTAAGFPARLAIAYEASRSGGEACAARFDQLLDPQRPKAAVLQVDFDIGPETLQPSLRSLSAQGVHEADVWYDNEATGELASVAVRLDEPHSDEDVVLMTADYSTFTELVVDSIARQDGLEWNGHIHWK